MVKRAIAAVLALVIGAGIIMTTMLVQEHNQREQMLEKVQRDHFNYFQVNQDPTTGLILDRNTDNSPASIAAVGFALSAYPVAVEREWVSRDEAAQWTVKVLRTLWNTPQGPDATGVNGYKGWFYHFLEPDTGVRAMKPKYWNSELSSIDTALLMSGALFAKEYYSGDSAIEAEIRDLADKLYKRVDWNWMANEKGLVYLAWTPETGMTEHAYTGYSEAVLIYILGMGSPTHPLPDYSWESYIGHEKTQTHYGQTYIKLHGAPLFVYQYPHTWIDFRGIRDKKADEIGFDWFENSRRATIAQHRYAIDNPLGWRGYNALMWGLTACEGPGLLRNINGVERFFVAYRERGAPDGYDDGTIAPTAAISSMPFAPELVLPTLKHWLESYPEIYNSQGFVDAFNPSLDDSTATGWVTPIAIGIDQGPILLMIENYRSEFLWKVMKNSSYLRHGLERAGFKGGWL